MCALLLLASSFAQAQTLDANWFTDRLYPVLEQAQCRQCHQDTGVGSRTRLQFPGDKPSRAEIQAFGYRLHKLVDAAHPEQSLLAQKPTRRIAHTGGERIKQGSADEQLLLEWVRHLASIAPADAQSRIAKAGVAKGKIPVSVRRLTHSQYNHTITDLLGDRTRPAQAFPPEDYINGFRNQIEGQSVSPLLAEAYSQVASRLAGAAFQGGDRRNLVPCEPRSASDTACRDQFLRQFGRRAFRRPLDPNELRLFGSLFDSAAKSGGFYDGARIVVEAMLQSPQFLFYARPGREGGPDPYETASRLSYFLWDTMPDEALLEAAASGQLDSPEQIERQVQRMLADPRAQAAMDEFLAQWLRFDRIATSVRERNLYPEFSPELAAAMMEETRRFFRHLAWEDHDFREFFNARYSFVNGPLAALYGVPAPDQDFAKVEFPDSARRAGIVGQASFLTLTSKPGDTSPTERGLFVREHFLCQHVPPPPPGVNTALPAITDDKPMGNRERLAIHLGSDACSGCHRLVDPIGFGLENYDAIGRFRDQQVIKIFPTADELKTKRKTKPSEFLMPIEATGNIQGVAGAEFSSPEQLGDILANDPGCQECVVKQLFRYAMGRHETPADRPALEAAFTRFKKSNFRFRELIIAIVTSRQFLGGAS